MPRRVLLVDDDPDILYGLSKVLTSPTVEVVTAASSPEAKARMEKAAYDVAIVDLMLDGNDPKEGLELLRYLTQQRPGRKRIAISGCGMPGIEAKAYVAGAHAFFTKPVSGKVLREEIDRA